MSSEENFDAAAYFSKYLSTLYHRDAYDIQVLSGGLVNHTARATQKKTTLSRTATNEDNSPSTVIAKYAPPFIARVGPAAPFSQDRQKVEAAALRLFQDGSGPLSAIARETHVRVPQVIHHDPDANTLLLQDLGVQYQVFWDALKAQSRTQPDTLCASMGRLGADVGAFFARLHSPQSLSLIRAAAVEGGEAGGLDASLLDRQLSKDIVLEYAVRSIPSILQQHSSLPQSEMDRLYERVLGDYVRPPLPGEVCFSLGDCHPGCIMVPPPPPPPAADGVEQGTGVIDWEFATTRGRGINGDMAQLLSYLHLFLLSRGRDTAQGKALREFTVRMCRAYSAASGVSLRAGDERWDIFRSALILHGREMINQAAEWQLGGDGIISTADMVRAGVWYLERAGDHVEHMLEEPNLSLLKGEEQGLMLKLFGLS